MQDFSTQTKENTDQCHKCGGALSARPAAPFPVVLQTVFGVSFLLFLWYTSGTKPDKNILIAWTFLQLVLAVLLVRARIRARKRVYRCTRCSSDLT